MTESAILGMQREPRVEVVSENDTDIDSTEGIDIYPKGAGTECRQDIFRALRITPADQHLSKLREGVGIAEKDHIEALAPQQPRSSTRSALAPGSVEHLDDNALRWRRRSWRGAGRRLAMRSQQQKQCRRHHCCRYREAAPVATRLFQNRAVGSGSGHPDSMI